MTPLQWWLRTKGFQSLGRNPFVTLKPPACSRIPWDLAMCKPPFEPLEEVPDKFLTIKTVFLLAISSLKRSSTFKPFLWPLHILSLRLAFLYPRPGYIPKVPSSVPRLVVLLAFPEGTRCCVSLPYFLLPCKHFLLLPEAAAVS